MFGQVLDALGETVSFEQKQEFLDACRNLNAQRIEIVHRLTQHTSIAEITARVVEVKLLYEQVFLAFEEAHDWFRGAFHSFAKESFIDLMEEDE
jgi:hypothetical protein